MSDFVREKRIARSTGLEVELLDSRHPEAYDRFPEAGRWVLFCVAHGLFDSCSTWREARLELGHPERWCVRCAEGREVDPKRPSRAKKEKPAPSRPLEAQWTDWTVARPDVERVYVAGEKETHRAMTVIVRDSQAKARSAKLGHRAAEKRLAVLPKIKSKREKKNRERLESEATSLDAKVVAQEDRARVAGEHRDRIARVAYLRGAIAAGWTLEAAATGGTGHFLSKGDRRIRIPADYLPAEDYGVARRTEES